MEYANTERTTTARGCLIGMIAIVVGIIVCVGGYYGVVDISCVSQANDELPVYPGAVLAEENINTMFRTYGIGQTTRTYYTPDSEGDVRDWYINFSAEQAEDDRGQGFATTRWRFISAPNDEGTFIQLSSDCAAGLGF